MSKRMLYTYRETMSLAQTHGGVRLKPISPITAHKTNNMGMHTLNIGMPFREGVIQLYQDLTSITQDGYKSAHVIYCGEDFFCVRQPCRCRRLWNSCNVRSILGD